MESVAVSLLRRGDIVLFENRLSLVPHTSYLEKNYVFVRHIELSRSHFRTRNGKRVMDVVKVRVRPRIRDSRTLRRFFHHMFVNTEERYIEFACNKAERVMRFANQDEAKAYTMLVQA